MLLLGSFSIAYNAANVLHELSHGLAAILTGGPFVAMTINPFSWSYCYSFTANRLVHLLAGAGGAILFGGLLFGILYRWARPWLLPALLIGPLAVLDNGSYYFVDIAMRSGGDACRLIDQGARPVVTINVLYAGLLVFLLAGPFSAFGQSSRETFKERPSDFAPVMTAPLFAVDVSYWTSSDPRIKGHFLSYGIPESITPDRIRNCLTDLHQEHGYHQIDRPIEDPNDVLNDGWTEETEEIYGRPVTTKSCKQCWIKISSPPVRSFIAVAYMWKRGQI